MIAFYVCLILTCFMVYYYIGCGKMRAIVTGSHGAVAPFIIKELESRGIEVAIFDRTKVDILDYYAVDNFIKQVNPDLFFHVATGDLRWISNIVRSCSDLGAKVIFISTVSVFSEHGTGPYTIDSVPDANDGYGIYKQQGEKIVKEYGNHLTARLGWQIGFEEGSNNMLDFLIKQHRNRGFIGASSKWYPSCSFLPDTAKTVVDLALTERGLYQINGNDKYNFYEIACGLNKKFNMNWDVRVEDSFARDDRMIDDRVSIKKIEF